MSCVKAHPTYPTPRVLCSLSIAKAHTIMKDHTNMLIFFKDQQTYLNKPLSIPHSSLPSSLDQMPSSNISPQKGYHKSFLFILQRSSSNKALGFSCSNLSDCMTIFKQAVFGALQYINTCIKSIESQTTTIIKIRALIKDI